jgi:hypothetical protein
MRKTTLSIADRRWTAGSYVAAGFALFMIAVKLGISLIGLSRPTDGWLTAGGLRSYPPEIRFLWSYFDEPSPIKSGDRLLKVYDQPLEQILEAGHAFLQVEAPDWPDGTLLKYEVLREGEQLTIDVPIRRASLWYLFTRSLFGQGQSLSNHVMTLTGLLFFIIGLGVFLVRPDSQAAHALLILGVGSLPIIRVNNSVPTFFYSNLPVSIPFDPWTLLINPSVMYLVLSFPYPKLPLRRYPRLSVLLLYLTFPLAFNLTYLLNLDSYRSYVEAAFRIYPVQIILLMLVTVISLVHSFITVRDPTGRTQLKWMVAGVCSFVFLGIGGWLISAYLFPETMQSGNWLTTAIGWLLLPVCLAVAITRYHLFDIDLIIRRTLVYTLLSGLLGGFYLGVVTVLQSLFASTSGQSSSFAIVLSTLAIAALFNPLRRRIQAFIDRRFYRQKYNAEQALSEFAAAARQETDLVELTRQVAGVVEQTVMPEQISLWLRPASFPIRARKE